MTQQEIFQKYSSWHYTNTLEEDDFEYLDESAFEKAAADIIKMCYCKEARYKSGIDIGMFIRPQLSEVDRLKIELGTAYMTYLDKFPAYTDRDLVNLINKIKELEND